MRKSIVVAALAIGVGVTIGSMHAQAPRRDGQVFPPNVSKRGNTQIDSSALNLLSLRVGFFADAIGPISFSEAAGDYEVKPDSPAIALGFVNFDMRNFGVQAPELKAITRTPELPSATSPKPVTLDSSRSRAIVEWQGAKVRNIVGLDEVSASGTPGETGVIVLDVPSDSHVGKAGITDNDVILGFNNKPVKDTQDLVRYTREASRGLRASITILRYGQTSTVSIALE